MYGGCMPYDFEKEVIEAMAETMIDNDKIKPALREKIKLYIQAKQLGDKMEDLMEGVRSASEVNKTPSPADTTDGNADAEDVAEEDGDD